MVRSNSFKLNARLINDDIKARTEEHESQGSVHTVQKL